MRLGHTVRGLRIAMPYFMGRAMGPTNCCHRCCLQAEPGVFMVGRPSGFAGTGAKCGFTATRLTQLSTAGNRLLHNVFQVRARV